jgi:hypothetical protein
MEDLQQMINDLLAQVAALQAGAGQGGTSVASGICPYTWTRDLSQGSTGADVMKLQQFLNSDLDTRVAVSGAGSVGMETEYYGPATAAAVSKMQVKYRAEILSPSNLVNPTGFFGPASRAKANAVCSVAPTTPTTPTTPVDEDEDEDTTTAPVTLRGEASLDTYEIRDASETTIEEGDRAAIIGEVTLEFANGDAEISRMDVRLSGGSSETRPWNAFRSIQLWVDGDKVAEKRIDRRSDYLNDSNGTIRFTGLNLVAREDEELEILVAVEVAGTVRGADVAGQETWTLTIQDIRFFDGDGVAETTSPTGQSTANFTIEEAGVNEEVRISLASNNPSSQNIIVDKTKATNGVTIFAFDLEGRNGDVDMETVVVRVDTPTATTTDVVSRAVLSLDGRNYTARSIRALDGGESTGDSLKLGRSENNGTTSVWYLFDIDRNFVAEDRDRVTARLSLDIRPTGNTFTNYANATRISAAIGNTEKGFWEAEGGRVLVTADFTGAASGETHTLLTAGAATEFVSDSFTAEKFGTEAASGTIAIVLDITAIDDSVLIAEDGSNITTSLTGATSAGAGSKVVSCTGTAAVGGNYTINDGQTRRCTVSVKFGQSAGNFVRLEVTAVAGTPANDIRTQQF